MKIYLIFILLLLTTACNFSTTKGYNIEVKGNISDKEKINIAQSVAGTVWNGNLKKMIKSQITELRDSDLNNMLGIKIQHMKFNEGTGVFIQCTFISSNSEEVASKVINLCKQEVELELTKF